MCPMTQYKFPPFTQNLSPTTWLEKKAKRKRQLEEVHARRKIIYDQYRKHQRLVNMHTDTPNSPTGDPWERRV